MRGGIQLTIALVLLLQLLRVADAHRCDRTPEGHVSPKIPADNRFQLKISGAPEKYVPGEGYTISLHGLRGQGQVAQKFTGFMLVVEAQSHMPLRVLSPRDVTPRPVGTFQLYGDTLTKFSPSCPNMVTHTSSMPKSEVQVRWTAPPPGSGCVIFRATVIEHRDVWYQDDGPLSKMLCEEVQESHDTQPEVMETCCACDEAKYEVTFEGLWSRHTHPKDFPSNSWLTRFSDVIGASHSTYYRFWEYGGIASEGLRQVAERGSTRMLESELKSQSQNIRTIIKARGISYPNVTGKTFAVFRVDKLHHLMSLVSMIDPSPDWIVGVSGLELCLLNCSWVESKVLNLYPWDAGTDSGVTYISPDQQTFPRDKIRRITTSFPNDPRSPFYDPSGVEMKPLARLYLTRQRLYEKTCEEEPTVTNECALSEWTDWGPCSSPCGPGTRHRQRQYLHRAAIHNCPRVKLTDKQHCTARQCRHSAQPTREPLDPQCEVKEWSDWSRCEPVDHTCKRGSQKRYRIVGPRNNLPNKYCVKIPQVQARDCTPSMSPAVCPKNNRGKVAYKDPQSSTCCAESSNDYGGNEESETNNEVTDPDDNEGVDENNVVEDGKEEEVEIEVDKDDGGVNEEGKDEDEENDGEREENVGSEDDGNGGGGGGDYEDMPGEPTGECAMTNWSEWSPCSVTCGSGGTSSRFRSLLTPEEDALEPRAEYLRAPRNEDNDYGTYDDETEKEAEGEGGSSEYAEGPCSIYKIKETMSCNGSLPTCQLTAEDAREVCGLAPHPGRCRGRLYTRWYYDPSLEDCSEFQYSGCRGNRNRFLTQEECQTACQAYTTTEADEQTTTEETSTGDGDLQVMGQTRDETGELVEGTERPVRNCKFSRWSEWSECEATCNQQGYKSRTRHILVHAKNGGKACVGKTRKQRKCTRKCRFNDDDRNEDEQGDANSEEEPRRASRCKYSDWSDWTECTATCGYTAMRQRTRQVLAGNMADCNDRVRKRTCNVGPCPQ